jgi:dTDP-4-amino-4,6-dideoxygalactose transaminase
VIEIALTYDRLRPLGLALRPLLSLKAWLSNRIKLKASAGNAHEHVNRAAIHMSVISRALIRMSDVARIVDLRRAHYRRLAEGLSQLPGARPLFPELPPNVVPYMFPLIVDTPQTVFPALKAKQVPIWRWEDLQHTGCEVSRGYAHRLLQLPCHQELHESEIDWMIGTIAETLSSAAT